MSTVKMFNRKVAKSNKTPLEVEQFTMRVRNEQGVPVRDINVKYIAPKGVVR